MNERYSVVIPSHQAAKTIERCLESVFSQTLAPIEILIIDDASSDDTQDVVARYQRLQQASAIKIQYIKLEVNVGPSAARNRGIRAASGSYVAFLDADDIWCRGKLEIIDRFIPELCPGLICHAYSEDLGQPRSHRGTYVGQQVSVAKLLWRNPAQTSCAVVRNVPSLAFNESMRYCEDHDLWMRILEHFPVVQLIGDPLTLLGRPQLSVGGLSGNVLRMRLGEMRVFYNFCRRNPKRRMGLFIPLMLFSIAKHAYSIIRRTSQKVRERYLRHASAS